MLKQYKVIKTSMGGAKADTGLTGCYSECYDLCEFLNWVLDDGYVWDLEIVEI